GYTLRSEDSRDAAPESRLKENLPLITLIIMMAISWGLEQFNHLKEPAKTIPNPKLNLVYIYGESLERTYFDNVAFPNLTPELGAL
ncbi:hypothetical protein MJM45_29150, partial [Salmonella enterica subsp. enterica serovar Kentucky]|nr:hypothetical protein [Salmonella enterica subsp. enterica serovar Kentucky]